MNRLIDGTIFSVSLGTFAFSTYATANITGVLYALAAFLTAVSAGGIAAVRIYHIFQHIRSGTPTDDPERPMPPMEHIDRPLIVTAHNLKGDPKDEHETRLQNV